MNDTIYQREKELIIARLELVSPKLFFSDGDNANAYSRDDMIRLIKEGDRVGVEFVRTELEFLRALKTGELMRKITGSPDASHSSYNESGA